MSAIFKPTSVTNLYVLENATGWIGYLLPDDTPFEGGNITLEASLNTYFGLYVFASKKPNINAPNFSSSIWTFLNKNSRGQKQRCFLWLNQDANTSELGFGQILVFNDDTNYIATADRTDYQKLQVNKSIFMAIPKYCSITVAGNSLFIKRETLTAGYRYGMYLNNTTTNKFIRLGNMDSRGVDIEAPITIPMIGNNGGCLQFNLSFPFTFPRDNTSYFIYENDRYPYNNTETDKYTILETGVKYYYKDIDHQGDTEMMYFLFNQDSLAKFKGSLDFSDIFNTQNPRRTYFAFTGKNSETDKTVLPSNFQTNFGKNIQLEPVVNFNLDGSPREDAALLVFSDAITLPSSHNKRYYWVPQGDFTLQSVIQNKHSITSTMLLCGISGTETVSFTPQNTNYIGDRIHFSTKKPAYSKQFKDLANPSDLKSSDDEKKLTHKYTTSWANIVKAPTPQGSPNNYYSQPNQAPLFEQGFVNGTLDYAEVPSANLIALAEDQASFPIATSAKATPVLGLIQPGSPGYYDQKDITRFENEILNPSRKQTIAQHYKTYRKNLVKAQAEESTTCPIENLTTTPQGFLVNLNSDKTEWKCLTLANNEPKNSTDAKTTLAPPLRFKAIDSKSDITGLQSAFQTNEQFLVISNPGLSNQEVLDYYIDNFQDKISIADWPFVFDIAHQNTVSNTTEEFTNIMIFKFCNKSIEERIADPKLWTNPNVFNDQNKIPQLIKWIQNYIETARQSVTAINAETPIESEGFQHFLNIIEDKDWHGVLTLQVTLNLESLPSQIKAILAGIDTSRFAAHHVGIEANQIKTKANNQLDPNFKSSLFGMISYFNSTYLEYQNGTRERPLIYPNSPNTYDFQVLNLQVLFKNSLISNFKSKIQLNMNEVFNEIVTTETATNTEAIYKYSILMNGQYDKKNGSTSYTFSVAKPNTLSLSSTAIDEVTITGIEMSTIDTISLPKTSNTAIASQITTRFIISGTLKFQTIEGFDLFSYKDLMFSNLMLDMAFNLNVKNPIDNTPKKTFTFSPSTIVFNRSTSRSRLKSLVSNFPIELENLLYHDVNTSSSPSTLGYMQVEAPLPTAPVGNSWYALRFKLNMGSLGALASKVGFNSEIILAWSPGKYNNQAQIYAKMPFSGGIGGTNFSIQGVLKFAIGSILFFNDPENNQYSMIFTKVGVSLLGKKLPPSGSTVLYLFGNPDNPSADVSGKSNVGWFGAYKQ